VLGLILLLQATLTLVVTGPPGSPEYLPLRVAESEGYFSREGLSVTLVTRDANPAAEMLALGQADLVATSLEAMLRFGPRLDYQQPLIVLGLTAAPPVALLVPLGADGTPRSVAALAGKRIGVSAPGVPDYTWLTGLLTRAGLRLTRVDIVSLGSRRLAPALASGMVQAAVVPEPAASQLVHDNTALVLADLRTPDGVRGAMGDLTLNAAVFVRSDRPPHDRLLESFARAVLDAERLLASASAEALAGRLPATLVGNPDEFERRLEASRGVWLPGGLVEPDQVRRTIGLVRDRLPLPPTLALPAPAKMLHMEPVKRAGAARER
jgi:ABC-type nitrate/sulfonate/bicarbonate transport system substrate-binding protein